MTWSWAGSISAAERQRAGQEPLRFFLAEFLKRAALMALLLAVAEWIWPTLTFASQPGKRLYLIVFWSALMAAFQLWLARPKSVGPKLG